MRPVTFAAVFYVATYSALAHKVRRVRMPAPARRAECSVSFQEVRFLFPALPLFNALAAAALAWCIQRARKSTLWSLVLLGCIGLLLATLVAKLVMSWAAFYNYPVRLPPVAPLAIVQSSQQHVNVFPSGWLGHDAAPGRGVCA